MQPGDPEAGSGEPQWVCNWRWSGGKKLEAGGSDLFPEAVDLRTGSGSQEGEQMGVISHLLLLCGDHQHGISREI